MTGLTGMVGWLAVLRRMVLKTWGAALNDLKPCSRVKTVGQGVQAKATMRQWGLDIFDERQENQCSGTGVENARRQNQKARRGPDYVRSCKLHQEFGQYLKNKPLKQGNNVAWFITLKYPNCCVIAYMGPNYRKLFLLNWREISRQ